MQPSPQDVGLNIRAIRRRRHLSQIELARRLKMRPGPVNCIEKGRNFPSARVLCRLSDILQVPIDAFFHGEFATQQHVVRESGESPATAAASGSGNLPLETLDRDRTELTADTTRMLDELTDAFLSLEDLCGAQKCAEIPLQISFTPTEPNIERLCQKVRRLLGVNEAIVFDYLEILENAGLRVLFCHLPREVESISCYDPANGNALIFACRDMNVERQLFRILYELGRIYCHTGAAGGGRPTASTGGRHKDALLDAHHAARKFAGLFLMPAATVTATVRQLGVPAWGWSYELLLRIKHRFGVSAQALLIRLKELRLINAELERQFSEQIKTHYRRTNFGEPHATRRILTPNGRIGDLLLIARELTGAEEEVQGIEKTLEQHGVEMP